MRCDNDGGEWKTYKIVFTKELAPKIKLFEVEAPEIAAKARPGQFVILIVDEKGERIPLTICGYDAKKGTVAFAFHEVGKLWIVKQHCNLSDQDMEQMAKVQILLAAKDK